MHLCPIKNIANPSTAQSAFYVQCKYGSKPISLSKDGNAVFVKQLVDVKPVLETLRSAAANGELDAYVAMAINARKSSEKST